MGIGKIGTTIGKEIIAWTRTCGKSMLATRPVNVNTVGLKYIPTASHCIKTNEISHIINTFSDLRDQKVVLGLLNENSLNLTRQFIKENDIGTNLYLRFLDVVKRRGHSAETIRKIIKSKEALNEKLIHSLEFKDFDKIKDVNLENFKNLSIEDKKSFINSFISINYRGGNKNFVENLPDIAIFRDIKDLKSPQMPKDMFDKTAYKTYLQSKNAYEKAVETTYDRILNSLLEQIPRGKKFLPNSPLKINSGCILDIKPPLTNSLATIPTNTTISHGFSIQTGELPASGKYMIHNLDEANLSRLEGLLLTDPNAILCTGYKGGIGYLKGGNRIGLIISPKSTKDLMIQAKGDMSSGYGAQKNLYNIQNLFLQAENEANNYIPNLIRKKMNISLDEYNQRIQKLGNVKYIEDVEKLDNELYEAIQTITSKEKMFEGIMRPNIEGIYLPKGYEITENIAKFAERYEIPILYG